MNGQIPLPPYQGTKQIELTTLESRAEALRKMREKYLVKPVLTLPTSALEVQPNFSNVDPSNRNKLFKAAFAVLSFVDQRRNAFFNKERDLVNTDTITPANNIVPFPRKDPLRVYNQKGAHGFEKEYNSDRNEVAPTT